MYRILLPVDKNTNRAVSQARYVSEIPVVDESIEVVVIFVFDDDDSLDPEMDESNRQPEQIESVTRVTEFFDDHDITYETRKDRGEPAEAILHQAQQLEANQIVVGGRKRSPAGKILFGSVTMSVLRNTDTPVVVTGDVTAGTGTD